MNNIWPRLTKVNLFIFKWGEHLIPFNPNMVKIEYHQQFMWDLNDQSLYLILNCSWQDLNERNTPIRFNNLLEQFKKLLWQTFNILKWATMRPSNQGHHITSYNLKRWFKWGAIPHRFEILNLEKFKWASNGYIAIIWF